MSFPIAITKQLRKKTQNNNKKSLPKFHYILSAGFIIFQEFCHFQYIISLWNRSYNYSHFYIVKKDNYQFSSQGTFWV